MENNQEIVREKIMELYNKIKEENNQNGVKENITQITYYEDLTLVKPKGDRMGVAEQDVFSVKISVDKDKNIYKLYTDFGKIAEIDEKGTISFSEEYIKLLEEGDPRFKEIIEKANNKEKIELPEEKEGKDAKETDKDDERKVEVGIKDLDPEEAKRQEEEQKNDKNNQEESKDEKDLNDEEKVAKAVGMKESDVTSCVEIDPDQRLTNTETFANTFGIDEGQYDRIYVVYTGNTGEDKRFSFVGVSRDGEAKKLDNFESMNRFQSQEKIIKINRDGSKVEEQKVMEMFSCGKNKEKGLSVTLGQFGVPEITYLRKNKAENKYMGSQVETSHVRPTTIEVLRFMDEGINNKNTFKQSMDDAKEQIEENASSKTELSKIDKYVDNDQGYDVDEEITMHDGNITTLRKEALDHGLSIEEYRNEIEKAEGNCTAEKIEKVNSEIAEEKAKEAEDERENAHEERERETPEEAALRRLHSQYNNSNK